MGTYALTDSSGVRHTFHFRPDDLERQYREFVEMDDGEFVRNAAVAAHFACIAAFSKGLRARDVFSDVGVIHETIHLATIPGDPVLDITRIRSDFERLLGPPYPVPKTHEEKASKRVRKSQVDWEAKQASERRQRVLAGLRDATVEQLRAELARREEEV